MREWKLIKRLSGNGELVWWLCNMGSGQGIALDHLNAYTTWITPDNHYHKQQFDTVEAAKLAVEMML